MIWNTALPTRWGAFMVQFTPRGLARLSFPDGSAPPAPTDTPPAGFAPQQATDGPAWRQQAQRAVERVLRGEPTGALPPFDWPARSTAFQVAVWEALGRIPPGETTSYGELAARLGRPRAARAVGQACGANPIPVLIPCHRVLAANGGLGGFSAGLAWKRRLLAAEQVALHLRSG